MTELRCAACGWLMKRSPLLAGLLYRHFGVAVGAGALLLLTATAILARLCLTMA